MFCPDFAPLTRRCWGPVRCNFAARTPSYSLLSTVRAFASGQTLRRLRPRLTPASRSRALRRARSGFQTPHGPPEVRSDRPPRTAAEFTTPVLDDRAVDFAVTCPLVRPGRPHIRFLSIGSRFAPRFLQTPPRGTTVRFASPSPSSGWAEDFHLQALDHARHTKKPRSLRSGARISNQTVDSLRSRE